MGIEKKGKKECESKKMKFRVFIGVYKKKFGSIYITQTLFNIFFFVQGRNQNYNCL
jgi:hypothetical protein